eukprot:SAG25_NODE_3489_length_1063_cov_0.984440_1_plen_56_part_10
MLDWDRSGNNDPMGCVEWSVRAIGPPAQETLPTTTPTTTTTTAPERAAEVLGSLEE